MKKVVKTTAQTLRGKCLMEIGSFGLTVVSAMFSLSY